MSDFLRKIKQPFQDKDYRHAYADGFLNSVIATQIKVLREQHHWSQERLAKESGMQQERISVLENVNYSSWSLSTLRRLAKAFDVRLKVTFETFATILEDFDILNRSSLERYSFPNDPTFATTEAIEKLPAEPHIGIMDGAETGLLRHLPDLPDPIRKSLGGPRPVSKPSLVSPRSKLDQLGSRPNETLVYSSL